MTFRVGQRVECINAGMGALDASSFLTKGAIYQINLVRIDGVGVPVVGLVGVSLHWRASRFRPIVERKTDISVFTQMLTPQEVDA